jgi:hypothetical protein
MEQINTIENFGSRRILFTVLTVLLFGGFAFQLVYHAVRTSATYTDLMPRVHK